MSAIELDRTAQVQIKATCPKCRGAKIFQHEDEIRGLINEPCTRCEGEGTILQWIDVKTLFQLSQ